MLRNFNPFESLVSRSPIPPSYEGLIRGTEHLRMFADTPLTPMG